MKVMKAGKCQVKMPMKAIISKARVLLKQGRIGIMVVVVAQSKLTMVEEINNNICKSQKMKILNNRHNNLKEEKMIWIRSCLTKRKKKKNLKAKTAISIKSKNGVN